VKPNTVNSDEASRWRVTALSLLCENAIQNSRCSKTHNNARNNWMRLQHFDGITARTSHWAINPELWSGGGKSWANLLSDRPFRREISFDAVLGIRTSDPIELDR
jgi:hypothetical protein